MTLDLCAGGKDPDRESVDGCGEGIPMEGTPEGGTLPAWVDAGCVKGSEEERQELPGEPTAPG